MLIVAIMFIGCAEEQKKWRIGVSQCSEDIWRHKQNGELVIIHFSGLTRYTMPELVRLRTIPSMLVRNWPNFVTADMPNDEPATCLMSSDCAMAMSVAFFSATSRLSMNVCLNSGGNRRRQNVDLL